MNLFKKHIHPALGLLLVFAALNGIIAYRLYAMGYFSKGGHLPAFDAAPAFDLTERTGQRLTNAALEGRVWVGSFIFTRCGGPCPLMSLKTQALLRELPDLAAVSFTSDPDYDSPEVLRTYARNYQAPADRWFFMTGPKEELGRIAKEFKFGGIDQPDLHSTRFALVDKKGVIRGYYDSNDPEHLARLKRDARSLI